MEEHKKYFSEETKLRVLLHSIHDTANKIWASSAPNDQDKINHEQEFLTQLVENTLNSAHREQGEFEENIKVWQAYHDYVEEKAPPSLYDLYSNVTENQFNEREISDSVDLLLKKLQFNWNLPSSHLFISKLSKMNNAKPMTIHLSQYLNDLILVSGPSPGSSSLSPSFIASSCLASAHQFLGLDIWPSCMVSITGYTLDQLFDSITYITRLHKNARRSEYQAVVKKYMEPDYYCVAMLDPKEPLRSK